MIKIALEGLSGCEGCEVSLLDSLPPLLEMIRGGRARIVYAPLLLDVEGYDDADVAIVTGSIRTLADEARIRRARAKCKHLVAFGSCACFGGIHGLADLQDISDEDGRASPEVRLNSEVEPTWRLVRVDSAMPGCPPPERHIAHFLENLLGPSPTSKGKTVCDECKRERSEEKKISSLRRDLVGIDAAHCLLDQSVPCLGFATAAGCGALCPSANYPCHGCMGFDDQLEKQCDGIARAISALASVLEVDDVEGALRDPVGFFLRFSYPSFELRESKRGNGIKGR
jgi:F420-non-reducing hydrogenase small subunit